MAAGGKRTFGIAATLDITTETINSHLKNIKRKLKVSSSFELMKFSRVFDLL